MNGRGEGGRARREGLTREDRRRVERTFEALRARGVEPWFVTDRKAALAKLIEIIPRGSLVAHGTSTTLDQIGFIEHARSPRSGWRYGNDEWRAENDAVKRARLRARISVDADVFLGSVQAVCETGEVIGTDMSGSRQAFYTYGPPRILWVAGINKLVTTVDAGIRRAREVALPLEDKRVKAAGGSGSSIGKLVIYEREKPGRTSLILVGESLGF